MWWLSLSLLLASIDGITGWGGGETKQIKKILGYHMKLSNGWFFTIMATINSINEPSF
jgi:hypothetical protein